MSTYEGQLAEEEDVEEPAGEEATWPYTGRGSPWQPAEEEDAEKLAGEEATWPYTGRRSPWQPAEGEAAEQPAGEEAAKRAHFIELRRRYQKNLYVLELQEAQYGILAIPVHIRNEIEATRAKIGEIDENLENLNKSIVLAASAVQKDHDDIPRQDVEITFNVASSKISPELRAATVRALVAILDIPTSAIVVCDVRAGSIIFSIELPKEAAEKLLELYDAEDPDIKAINLSRIELVMREEDRKNVEQKSLEQPLQELLNKKPQK